MVVRRVVSTLAGCALLFVLSAVCAKAQLTDTGTIAGTITDQSDATVPDAKIIVTNLGTNIQQTAVSDAAGQYVVNSLKIGTYSLSVERAGFRTYIQSGIVVDVQSRVAVDVKLQVGAAAQEIQVSAGATLLHTQTAEIGQVIGSQQIVDLPLNTRQYDSLVFLSPGVTLASNNLRTNAGEGYFDANGNSGIQNNYVLDGTDNNSIVENFQGKSAQAGQPPVDAVAEFKLQTRTYDTEFGRSAGAVVNAQIKSGTNQLHGDGWEFIRNDHLDASNYFSNAAGAAKPSFQQNQFGGTVGGPIVKDKAFFFGAFERTPLRIGVTQVGTVPTAQMQQLDFSELPTPPTNPTSAVTTTYPQLTNCFTGAVVTNPSCIDPVGLKLLHLYPAPNTNLGSEGVAGGFTGNNFIASPKETQNVNNGLIRADQKIGEKDALFEHWTFYGLYEHYPYIFQGTANPIADGATDISIWNVRNQTGSVGWTHIFNPTTVLDVRGGYNRMRENAYPYNFGKIVNPQFGINGIPVIPGVSGALPEFDVSGFSNLGASRWTPMVEKSYVYQYRGILSKIKGAHTIKAGAEWRRDAQDYVDDCCYRGEFGFNGQYAGTTGYGITDMVLGTPQGVSLSNYEAVYAYYNGLNLFGQDTWRVTPKLTVNYGLRYELVTPLMSRNNHIGNFNPNANGGFGAGGAFFAVPANATDPATRASVEYYKKGFAPRMGLAYSITNKLVFRGGYGIFYQNYDRRGSLSDLNENPPFLVSYTPSFQQTQPPSFLLQQGFPANTLAPPDISVPADIAASQLFGQDYHTRPGMIQQSSGGFEYSFTPNLLLSASWVGNYGHRLWRYVNLNQKILNTPGQPSGDIPFPDFAINPTGLPATQVNPSSIQWMESSGDSSYNALLISLQKRFSNGLTFLVAYTDSKGFSNFTANLDSGFRGQAPENTWAGSSKGLMAMDTPQRIVTSATYLLPFGTGTNHFTSGAAARILGNWQVNGILTFASGQPLSINSPFDTSQTGAYTSLTNCSGPTGGGPKTVKDWFNLAPYSVPSLYTFGNCGFTPGPRTPGINNFDASLYKDFRISERFRVQFRAEAYDFFNHPQFGNPNTGCSAAVGQSCAGVGTFGQITSLNVNTPPRQLQFALKVFF